MILIISGITLLVGVLLTYSKKVFKGNYSILIEFGYVLIVGTIFIGFVYLGGSRKVKERVTSLEVLNTTKAPDGKYVIFFGGKVAIFDRYRDVMKIDSTTQFEFVERLNSYGKVLEEEIRIKE